ncbi:MAG: zinc ABC transporter substrate-binding protein [Sedimentisphaerales bacterium]|nr:zinc ABC transporter substrate-binding protein [Sedimentisphaerales bacterium]
MTVIPKRLLLALAVVLTILLCVEVQAAREQQRTRFRGGRTGADAKPMRVVATLPDYAELTRIVGGERVTVEHIVHGVQDPHRIRPKPSFITMVKHADVLIATGLDLEMWLPTVTDKSGNRRVRSGEIGYVAVADGIELVEKPTILSQSEGDVHVFGNPHITTSPINAIQVAKNICTGLTKNDPDNREYYEENFNLLRSELQNRLFGEELVKLLGGDTLCTLAAKGQVIKFLEDNKLQGKPLIDKLGGWMKKMMPLRGTPVVVYHKDWSYLLKLFGLEEAGDVEPKPGIPPSLKHVTELIDLMRQRNIRIILAANYFDEQKTRSIADKTGAKAVILPLFVGGTPGVNDYFQLVDLWTDALLKATEDAK